MARSMVLLEFFEPWGVDALLPSSFKRMQQFGKSKPWWEHEERCW